MAGFRGRGEKSSRKNKIPNLSSARLFPDCAAEKRFSFTEQPLSSACDLNRRTNLDGSKQRKEVFKQKGSKGSKGRRAPSRKKRVVATVANQCLYTTSQSNLVRSLKLCYLRFLFVQKCLLCFVVSVHELNHPFFFKRIQQTRTAPNLSSINSTGCCNRARSKCFRDRPWDNTSTPVLCRAVRLVSPISLTVLRYNCGIGNRLLMIRFSTLGWIKPR